MGLIALPATIEEGGWLSLGVLLAFAVICCYTGALLGRCIKRNPELKNYPDVAGAAYGSWGRNIVMVLLFFDIASFLIGSTIALGDNLARIFPNAGLNFPAWGISLEPSQVLVTIAVMIVLPTTWFRDMKSLSFVSVGGVITSLVVMGSLAWAGLFGGVGFHHQPRLFNISKLPIVSGIFAYCFAGHIVIPNIYSGMANPAQFPKVSLPKVFMYTVVLVTLRRATYLKALGGHINI
jgi:vesicular inhibitory amino acid transporter